MAARHNKMFADEMTIAVFYPKKIHVSCNLRAVMRPQGDSDELVRASVFVFRDGQEVLPGSIDDRLIPFDVAFSRPDEESFSSPEGDLRVADCLSLLYALAYTVGEPKFVKGFCFP